MKDDIEIVANEKNDETVWKQTMVIKGEETCEMELTEKEGKGKIKRKVVIKNGQVVEKPADVDILGENTPDGFIVKGLRINRKREIRGIKWRKGGKDITIGLNKE